MVGIESQKEFMKILEIKIDATNNFWYYFDDVTIWEPKDWPLHAGNANGFIAANGDADTILPIPKKS